MLHGSDTQNRFDTCQRWGGRSATETHAGQPSVAQSRSLRVGRVALVLLLARSARNSPGPQAPGLRDRWLTRMGFRRRSASPQPPSVGPAFGIAAAEQTSTVPENSLPPLAPSRDTAGAIAALELAFAYIVEVRDAPTPAHDDKLARKEHLNTLSLAAKQLGLARNLDPDAVLESSDGDGAGLRFTQSELEAEALLLEGITHHASVLRSAPRHSGARPRNSAESERPSRLLCPRPRARRQPQQERRTGRVRARGRARPQEPHLSQRAQPHAEPVRRRDRRLQGDAGRKSRISPQRRISRLSSSPLPSGIS